MGTPGPNSYLVGETAGRNMLDAARAAHSLLKEAVSNRVVLWGHSQGGQGALFARQIARTYAPELDVRAVAVARLPLISPSSWTPISVTSLV